MKSQSLSQQVRKLQGKIVKKVRLNAKWDGERKQWLYDPAIIFTDGSFLVFTVVESDNEYGISPSVMLMEKADE